MQFVSVLYSWSTPNIGLALSALEGVQPSSALVNT